MLEGIIFFAIGLFIFAAIGHGIWLLGAAILRLLLGALNDDKRPAQPRSSGRPEPPSRLESCPVCTVPIGFEQHTCVGCGWPNVDAHQEKRQALALDAVRRTAKRFRGMEWLDLDSFLRIECALDEAIALSEHAPAVETPQAEVAATTEAPSQPQTIPVASAEPATEEPPVDVAPPIADMVSVAPPPHADSSGRVAHAAAPAAPTKPRPPRFASFLEEKNIRWGELIGGLLILCSSIALVLSFWQQISERPLLKFGLFNGVTAALFLIGLYVERRWRLPTTTHGVLLIAMLLVPLNFLAVAAFTLHSPPTEPLTIGGELLSIVLFAGLGLQAARILMPTAPWAATAAVVGCAAWQLVVRRLVRPDSSPPLLLGLGLAPIAAYAWPVAAITRRFSKNHECGEREANEIFKVVGTTLFAAVLPLGLILAKTEHVASSLARLAPLVSLLGAPLLAVGMLLWRRLTDPSVLKERIAGTAVAVAGVFGMAAATMLGWPTPAGMVPTALVNAVIFTWAARRSEVAQAHLLAALSLAGAYLVGAHVYQISNETGRLPWNGDDAGLAAQILLSGPSGMALVLPALLYVVPIAVLRRRRESSWYEAARWYAAAGALLAAASAALVLVFLRRGDPYCATYIFALYGLIALVAAGAMRRAALAYVGSSLLLASLLTALLVRFPDRFATTEAWLYALLAHSLGSLLATLALDRFGLKFRNSLVVPLERLAVVTSIAAAPAVGAAMAYHHPTAGAVGATGIAFAWGVLLIRPASIGWLESWQAATLFAVGQWTYVGLLHKDWFADIAGYTPLLDPRALAWFGLGATGVAAVWLGARVFVRRSTWSSVWRSLLLTRTTADSFIAVGLPALVVALATYAVLPGVLQELSFRTFTPPEPRVGPSLSAFEFAGIPHQAAQGGAVWTLWAAVLALVCGSLWERFTKGKLAGVIVLAAVASYLIAGRWESEIAVASALRWTSAAALIILSLPIWFRNLLRPLIGKLRLPGLAEQTATLPHFGFQIALCATLFAPLMMIVGLGATAIANYDSRYYHPARTTSLPEPELLFYAFVATTVVAGVALASAALVRFVGRRLAATAAREWVDLSATVVGLLGASPLLVLLIYWQAVALKASPILGPDPASWFVRVGLAVSYAVPLAATAIAIIGHAVSLRSARLGFASSLVLNFTATIAYILALVPQGLKFDGSLWLRIGQLNQSVTALFAIAWCFVAWKRFATNNADEMRTRDESSDTDRVVPVGSAEPPPIFSSAALTPWLTRQVALACATAAAGLIASTFWLLVNLRSALGDEAGLVSAAMADYGAWGALSAVVAAVAVYFRTTQRAATPGVWSCAGLAVAALFAMVTAWKTAAGGAEWPNLIGAKTLAFAWLGVAAATTAAGCFACRTTNTAGWLRFGPPSSASRWATFVAALAWLVAKWIIFEGPSRYAGESLSGFDRLPEVVLLLVAFLAPILAAWRGTRWRLYLAAFIFVDLAQLWWWEDIGHRLYPEMFEYDAVFTLFTLIGWALPTPLWLWIDNRFIRPHLAALTAGLPPLGYVTAISSLVAVGFATAISLSADFFREPMMFPQSLLAISAIMTAAAVASCLWDRHARWAVAATYAAGLIGVGVALAAHDLAPRMLIWWCVVAGSLYVFITALAWNRRRALFRLVQALRMPQRFADERAGAVWLGPTNVTLAVAVVVPALWCATHLDALELRLGATLAIVAVSASVGLLARGDSGRTLHRLALDGGVIASVALVWAGITPTLGGFFGHEEFLNRAVLAASALAVMVGVYGVGFAKLFTKENAWTQTGEEITPQLVGLAGTALMIVLGVEVYEYARYDGLVTIAWPAIIAVAGALVALVVACLVAALVPGRDPFQLSERGRTVYVYAAEVLLAVMFAHIRLTMPWLFRGLFLQYWPVIIVLLAFLGVGLSELFRRKRQPVLSEPLEKTGALLPLLPVFGFWATDTDVHYSLLLLAVGGLYATLAVLRKSFGFGILATLAANGGLWYFLGQQQGLGWLEHPQLWLIPPALCVLIAGHLNRSRMPREQALGMRYAAAATIYVSSTADVFLNGVAQAPYLPPVLGGLALCGVFAGIALRIRAFLYLGTTFLAIALATVIWHAGYNENRTWIFYVTGIVAGVLIIALFAVFEKKRQELLEVVEKLREWE